MNELKTVAEKFSIVGNFADCRPMGCGHVNKTYLLVTDKAEYTFQRINGAVFKDVGAIMENVVAVTEHIGKKRPTVTVVKTLDGKDYYTDGREYFRMMTFFDGVVKNKSESAEDMLIAGRGFGQFQADLSDYRGKLNVTIPDFHNTPMRYRNFIKAVEEADGKGFGERKNKAFDLISEYVARKNTADGLTKPLFDGKIPYRVTHNDTKINNLVLDKSGTRPLCVIDLDTVMEGSLLFDFGDAIRSGGTTAAEDEPDTALIKFNLEYYSAFLEGFGGELRGVIEENERKLLPLSARIMTFECGMRFLTDYLQGDVYFGIEYSDHNLVRAASQMALVKDMERNFDKMEKVTDEFFAK